ncbi:hypothetical protein [Streptomyces sp. NRRL S-87]|uniref:hypothetical protein n=1 Tax=Streptomyces sp. NRRL S-87 TaxID=1463920 RepID=UPI0004BE61AA|nr:hypothetical protein [Streptomyces sp. NRRL S-87]
MTTTSPGDRLDLALLYALLGVPDHEDGRDLVAAAREVSATLPQLVISVAAREGTPLGTGSTDELSRARARSARYARFRAAVAEAAPRARVVKGPSLAVRYPAGVVRPVGDLDLVLPAQEDLWAAARALTTGHGAAPHELTLVADGTGRLHVLLTLAWPSPDPLLEQELRVELSTAAFYGDLGALPLRAGLPGPQPLADLLSVVEERLQREFHAKDAVDVLTLLHAGELDDTAVVVDALAAFRLAPEALELFGLVGAHAPHPTLEALTGLLGPLAALERARRAAVPPRPEPTGVRARLDAGLPVWGMLLDTGDTGPRRAPGHRLVLDEFHHAPPHDAPAHAPAAAEATLLAHTPVGSFLLVAGELVDPALHAAALARLTPGAAA